MFTPHDALVTGGAGFIGCNLVRQLLLDNCNVYVLDNLSRPGSKENLEWLRLFNKGNLIFHKRDIREVDIVKDLVSKVDVVYHLAAQVGVTSSLIDPADDFSINAQGTLNILEAARRASSPPIIIYASTNKVYGDLQDFKIQLGLTRYEFVGKDSVSETDKIDLKTPYGCSKGIGDLYCLEYARSYNLRTIICRQSCIYGPRQKGTEDQGWVAWLVRQAIKGEIIDIYGDGFQVRDVLHVYDLIKCYCKAIENIHTTCGKAYNIGGGTKFSVSVWQEFYLLVQELTSLPVVNYHNWRPNDQKIYISDIYRAFQDFGWFPTIAMTPDVLKVALLE